MFDVVGQRSQDETEVVKPRTKINDQGSNPVMEKQLMYFYFLAQF